MTSSLPAPAATDRPGEEGNGRRTRVHAVCAPPYGRNPGMSTVDLGLARVAEHLGPDVDVRCWRLWDDGEWRKPAGRTRVVGPALVNDVDSGLDYSLVRGREDELADCDVLLYWGDFHHMAPYQRSTVEVLTSELAAPLDPIEAAAVARRVLLQEGADADLRSRTLSYGTTLSLNAAEDYRGDYGDLLGGFVRGARQVWFRDPYSAGVAGTLRGDAAGHHGVDAAVLAGVLPHTPGNGGLEVFLGRSSVLPEEVALLGRALARETGTDPQWLPWGKGPAFAPIGMRPRFRRAWGAASAETHEELPLPELLDRVRDASLVLTDTYHLAVNAWRLGTPAVLLAPGGGIAADVNGGSATSYRDKRRDLYSQWEALPLLLDLRAARFRQGAEARRLAKHLATPDLLDVTWGRVRALEQQALDTLRVAVGDGPLARVKG